MNKIYIVGISIKWYIIHILLYQQPEGMAVGVVFAGFLAGNAGIALFEAIILALGIAIQNIPEGAIISMPLKMKGEQKGKAFTSGVLSGVVEPIAAFATVLLLNLVVPFLPYLLSFAAGAMIFVVAEELIPEMHEGQKSAIRSNRSNNRFCNHDGTRHSIRLNA